MEPAGQDPRVEPAGFASGSAPAPVHQFSSTSVETVEFDGGVHVSTVGEVDAQTAPDVERDLQTFGPHRLLADLSRVAFFDTAVVSVLPATAHRVRGLSGSPSIVAMSSAP